MTGNALSARGSVGRFPVFDCLCAIGVSGGHYRDRTGIPDQFLTLQNITGCIPIIPVAPSAPVSIFGEFRVAADTFTLSSTLAGVPEAVIEIDRVVASDETLTPYFWVSEVPFDAFE